MGFVNGSLSGEAMVCSSIMLSNLREDTTKGFYNPYSQECFEYGKIRKKNPFSKHKKMFKSFFDAVDVIWSLDNGARSLLGMIGVNMDYSSDAIKKYSDSKGYIPDGNGNIRLMVGGGEELFIGGISEAFERFIISGSYASSSGLIGESCFPIFMDGAIGKNVLVTGDGLITGIANGCVCIRDGFQMSGIVNGDDILIRNNTVVEGMILGDQTTVTESVVLGSVSGKRSGLSTEKDANLITSSFIGKTGHVKGRFLITNSLVDGIVDGSEAYGTHRTRRKTMTASRMAIEVNGQMVAPSERLTVSGIAAYYQISAAQTVNSLGRMFSRSFDFGELDKIMGTDYYIALYERDYENAEKLIEYLKARIVQEKTREDFDRDVLESLTEELKRAEILLGNIKAGIGTISERV